ncbi:hypothetical protein ACKWTF_003753 [Chironomus riparius]
MAKIHSLLFAVLVIICITYANCECDSDLLRDYAVDACNHIHKRSALHNIYQVDDIFAKHHYVRHYKKLTHEGFPSGGYLRIRDKHIHHLSHKKRNDDLYDDATINEIPDLEPYNERLNTIRDNSNEDNDVFSSGMDSNFNHKSNHKTFRNKRDASKDIPIDYCCSQANRDICSRYSCH